MKRRLVTAGALALVTLFITSPAAQTPAPAAAAADRTITVTYKGKGVVDATHDILVFAFDHPNPSGDSNPLGLKYVQKNGGSVTFTGLADPVYIYVVYDEQGTYDGTSGPPPAGTPIASYAGPKGEPLAIKAGEKVKLTFTDATRWK